MTLSALEGATTLPRSVAWAFQVDFDPESVGAEKAKSAEGERAITLPGTLEGATTLPRQTGWTTHVKDTPKDESTEKVIQGVESAIASLWVRISVSTHQAPKLVTQPSAKSMITDRVQATLDKLLPLIQRAARRSYIQVSKVEVSGFVDPDDETKQVVVTQWINAPSYIALKYWDRLGLLIEDWIKSLPDELARIANERIAIEVLWLQQ